MSGSQRLCTCLPLTMKGEHTLVSGQVDSHSLPHTLSSPAGTTLEQSLVSTGNTTHSGSRVLRSGGPNHSKPSVFIVFLHLDRTNSSYPEFILPQGLGGGWVYHPTALIFEFAACFCHALWGSGTAKWRCRQFKGNSSAI